MGNYLPFLAALCSGAAVMLASRYIMSALSSVELEKKNQFEKHIPVMFKLLYPFVAMTRRWANSKAFDAWRGMMRTKLQMAGYDDVIPAEDFTALRLLFIVVGLGLAFAGVFSKQPMGCIIVGGLLTIYPGAWLNGVIKKRHNSIMKALPNVLDLLTLSVESGKDLVSALRDILARRKMDDLGEELMRTFQEIQLGRKRSEALKAMGDRVRQVDLSATLNAIVQAEELGVSIAQLLRIQGDTQRAKRFAMAEKQANEAPVKIIIPVVLFILPAVFIILMGPLIMTTINQFR